MSTAQVPPTSESVAETLTDSDNDFHDGNGWKLAITATGNVVSIEVDPLDEDGDYVDTVHFRAVVVEGTEPPIIFDRATFEQRINERFNNAIRKLGSESIAFMPATVAALRQQILSLDVDLSDQGEAETR